MAGSARDLTAWLAAAVGPGVPVAVAASVGGDDPGVVVRPVRLLPEPAARGTGGTAPLRLRVRYAVEVTGPAGDALALLDRILLALAGTDRYPLVPDGHPGSPWPAITLDVPVRVDVPAAPVPRVSGGLRLDAAVPRTIHGRLVGPGGTPLAGMTVAASGTGTRVRTDEHGRFALPGQPAGRPVALHLSGRGLRLRVDVVPAQAEPLVVTCDPAPIPPSHSEREEK